MAVDYAHRAYSFLDVFFSAFAQFMKIVGICLVRNDDRFLDQVIRNVIDFCDELYITDHRSTDRTSEIANRWVDEHEHVFYQSINHPSESHEVIRRYAGEDVWIFGVDGDELYEKTVLAKFKSRLLSGEFENTWQILGKVLHCNHLEKDFSKASGYLARPSRSMTKLYNFSRIDDWGGECSERLHHGDIVFKEGVTGNKDSSESEKDWEEADFRCLHTVFMRRSSLQSEQSINARPNIAEKNAFSKFQKIRYLLLKSLGLEPESKTKDTYMRGPLVQKDVADFFREK